MPVIKHGTPIPSQPNQQSQVHIDLDLRAAVSAGAISEAATVGDRREESPWCDFAFVVAGERITLHRAILAARSPFFRRQLLSDWQRRVGPSSSSCLLRGGM
jgi:hypothetical protein